MSSRGSLRRRDLHYVLVILLLVIHRVSASTAHSTETYVEDTDRFPGWKGELPRVQQPDPHSVGYGEGGVEEWRGVVEQISWTPRAFLFKKFLSDDECDHLVNHAKNRMTKSSVVDSETGGSVDSSVRTSTGTFFSRGEDEVIRRIERRISHVSFLPVENGEGVQVLHYRDGEKYEAHHDWFHDHVNASPENGGQRTATMLMYLTTPEEGGETVFPQAATKSEGPGWSDCAKEGLAVKAIRGNAILFYSTKPNGETDDASLHGSCPTTKGDKFSATKWIHTGEFGKPVSFDPEAPGGLCADGDLRCRAWASSGECTRNPKYMMAHCRRSCKACTE